MPPARATACSSPARATRPTRNSPTRSCPSTTARWCASSSPSRKSSRSEPLSMPTFAAEKMAAWTGGRWTRIPGGALGGFTQDTRQLAAGQVFVAVKTDKRDGHDYLDEAQKRGANAALVGRAVAGSALPQLVVADPLVAFQRIAREYRREFHGT